MRVFQIKCKNCEEHYFYTFPPPPKPNTISTFATFRVKGKCKG